MNTKKSKHYYQTDRNIDNTKQNNLSDINNKHISELIDQYGGRTRTGAMSPEIKDQQAENRKLHLQINRLKEERDTIYLNQKYNNGDFLKNHNTSEYDDRVPEYYRGRNGYEARKVCDNFDLTYHLATATTYIIRAYRKHDSPVECLTKAIAHLQFELEKINDK